MNLKSLCGLSCAIVMSVPSLALAAPVTLYVHNATTHDTASSAATGTLTGSFDFDTDTGNYSNINLVHKDLTDDVITTYTTQVPSSFIAHSRNNLALVPAGATSSNTYNGMMLKLEFNPLTAPLSTITIQGPLSRIGECQSNGMTMCSIRPNAQNIAAGGYLSTASSPAGPTSVPTLTEWAMILMALALGGAAALTVNRRRQAL